MSVLPSSSPSHSVSDESGASVRLREVAEAAGVSVITVSRCMSNPNRVSRKTREHVLAVAARMGYIPNKLASGLVSARTMVIGLVVPTIANPIHGVIMQGLTDVLEPAGYKLLLGSSHFSKKAELDLVRTFLGYRVDGVILTGKDHTDECAEVLRRAGVPVVEMFDYTPAPIDVSVGTSNFDAGAALAEYGIARERKHLAFVGHTGLEDSRMMSRLDGIRQACAQAGIPQPSHYETSSDPGTGDGGEIIGTILREVPQTDMIIFAGHQVAVGAIRYAKSLKIDVPGRVAIAGFGDSPIAQWSSPSLTTIRFPVRETGLEAGRMMLDRLAGRRPANPAARLGFELLSRESA